MSSLHSPHASQHSQIVKCDPPKSREDPGPFLPLFASVSDRGRATVSSCKVKMETGKSASAGLNFPPVAAAVKRPELFLKPFSETLVLAMDLFS